MPYRLISQQMLLEHEVVARLSDALRTAVGWSHHGGASHQLASMLFLTESFQRHLERMFSLEEQGGYLELAGKSHPQRQAELDEFRKEHKRFGQQTHNLLEGMQKLDAPTHAELAPVLDEISELVDQIDAHNKREINFLQEIMLSGASDSPPQG